MKTLPLISNDYSFDWTKDEITQRAYNSLISQGQTGDFSYTVWNQIVDNLSSAMSEAKLTWNTTYGTVTETKMEQFDELTSNRFNAVTHNIEILINFSWKWAVNPSVKGYLGRPRVYGVRERGKNADYVYGWYLVELARVVNLFVDILRNEANFGEVVYQSIIPMVDYTLAHGKTSRPMTHGKVMYSVDQVQALTRARALLNLQSLSFSKYYANIGSAYARVLIGYGDVWSLHEAKMNTSKAKLIKPRDNIVDIVDYGKLVNAQGLPTNHENIVSVKDGVNVGVSIPHYLRLQELSFTKDYVYISNKVPKYSRVNAITHSKSNAKVTTLDVVNTKHDGIVDVLDNVRMATIGFKDAVVESIVKTLHFVRLSVESDWLYPIQTGTNLYIRQVYDASQSNNDLYLDVDGQWLEPIQTGTNLYIRQAESLEGSEL